VFEENLKVYTFKYKQEVIKIRNHRNNLLFSYYRLGFRCFELNLFSHCFDLKYLNLNKRFERLRKDSLFTLQLT